jgi:hypothetical protein
LTRRRPLFLVGGTPRLIKRTQRLRRQQMKRTLLWALVAINVVLLAALVMPYIKGNTAMAQRAGAGAAAGGGRRPELMMIPGQQVGGGANDIVYLIDTANRQVAAVALNSKQNGLDTVPPQDLERVFNDRAAPAGPNNGRGPNKTGARGGAK